jgi:proteasome beta subunit
VPIFATFDHGVKPAARLYFYDAMGAQFEAADYCATGSGSPAVRGILYYANKWSGKPLAAMSEDEAIATALRSLDTAAESDTATGGVDRNARIFPILKIVSEKGISTLSDARIGEIFKRLVA